MEKISSYRDLKVWQEGMDLASDVYRLTSSYPDRERFGLVQQLRRASVSIPSNVAEGHARDSIKEFLKFLSITLGSLAELETQLLLSKELSLGRVDEIEGILTRCDHLGKMTRNLQKALRARLASSQSPVPSHQPRL